VNLVQYEETQRATAAVREVGEGGEDSGGLGEKEGEESSASPTETPLEITENSPEMNRNSDQSLQQQRLLQQQKITSPQKHPKRTPIITPFLKPQPSPSSTDDSSASGDTSVPAPAPAPASSLTYTALIETMHVSTETSDYTKGLQGHIDRLENLAELQKNMVLNCC